MQCGIKPGQLPAVRLGACAPLCVCVCVCVCVGRVFGWKKGEVPIPNRRGARGWACRHFTAFPFLAAITFEAGLPFREALETVERGAAECDAAVFNLRRLARRDALVAAADKNAARPLTPPPPPSPDVSFTRQAIWRGG